MLFDNEDKIAFEAIDNALSLSYEQGGIVEFEIDAVEALVTKIKSYDPGCSNPETAANVASATSASRGIASEHD